MFPVLFHFGPVVVYSYGVMVGVGALLGIWWGLRLAKREALASAARLEGAALTILVSTIAGARLLGIVDYADWQGPWQSLNGQIVGQGGVFYGAFLFGIAGFALYARMVKLPVWAGLDCVAPGAAVAIGVGRIGCFLAGCCWGTPTKLPFGVTFTSVLANQLDGVPLNVKLHPTQLYEAGLVLLFIPVLRWARTKRAFEGQVILMFALYYATVRFCLEFVRGDPRGSYFHGFLSTSQFIGLVLVPVVLFLMAKRSKQSGYAKGCLADLPR